MRKTLRIRELRERAGMSQIMLARRAGLKAASICQWELGSSEPRASALPPLASALGVTVDELFETVEGEVVETGPDWRMQHINKYAPGDAEEGEGQSLSQPEGLTAPFTQGSL